MKTLKVDLTFEVPDETTMATALRTLARLIGGYAFAVYWGHRKPTMDKVKGTIQWTL